MSARLFGAVWELDLRGTPRDVLLVYADHANEDDLAWPGLDLVAWKVGVHKRQVQRVLPDLVEAGLLVPVANQDGGRGKSTVYRVNPAAGAKKEEPPVKDDTQASLNLWVKKSRAQKGDAQMSPFELGKGDILAPPAGERVTPGAVKGDAQMSPEPREPYTPAVVVVEDSPGVAPPSPDDDHDDDGVAPGEEPAPTGPGADPERETALAEMRAATNDWLRERLPPKSDPQRRDEVNRWRDELRPLLFDAGQRPHEAWEHPRRPGEPVPWAERPAIWERALGYRGDGTSTRIRAAVRLAALEILDPRAASAPAPGTEAAAVATSSRSETPGDQRHLHGGGGELERVRVEPSVDRQGISSAEIAAWRGEPSNRPELAEILRAARRECWAGVPRQRRPKRRSVMFRSVVDRLIAERIRDGPGARASPAGVGT